MTTYATEKVGTTKDYSIFQYFDRSRLVNKNHVEFLRKDMNINGQLERVIVNENWFVIDGQHRIEAKKRDKKPVDFRVQKGGTIQHVTAINNTPKGWTNVNWQRNYSHADHPNNKAYIQYGDFKKDHGFTETICMALLSEDFHDYGRKAFKRGTFKVKNLERATSTAYQLAELVAIDKRLNGLKAVCAILNLKTLKDFKFNVFKSQLDKNYKRLTPCQNINEWVETLIDDVYNHGLRRPHKRLINRYI